MMKKNQQTMPKNGTKYKIPNLNIKTCRQAKDGLLNEKCAEKN